MPGTGSLRRSSRADRNQAIVGKSRVEAARRHAKKPPKNITVAEGVESSATDMEVEFAPIGGI
jgi:hypothetical protein